MARPIRLRWRWCCRGCVLDLPARRYPHLAGCRGTSDTAAAILYALKLWPALPRYADDGHVDIDIDNSAAGRALRGVALGRRNFLFAGADSGRERAAAMYGLIGTAKLNGIASKPGCAMC